jgi:cytochrome b6-f complex iron-sulfur subunit
MDDLRQAAGTATPATGDARLEQDSSEMSRRSFLIILLASTGLLGAAGLLAPIVRFAFPTASAQVATKVKVTNMADLTAAGGELDFEYQETSASLVLQKDGTVVGLSRICTHLGCIIKWQPDGDRFFCPCHAGVFSTTGEVLGGPPPRALPKLKVAIQGSDIWVDGWES